MKTVATVEEYLADVPQPVGTTLPNMATEKSGVRDVFAALRGSIENPGRHARRFKAWIEEHR